MASPTILTAVYRGDRAAPERLLADGAIVSRLLTSGADAGARAAGGYGPLHIAAFRDDVALVDTLPAHGAAAARADDGKTALTIAEEQGHGQVARRLRGEGP